MTRPPSRPKPGATALSTVQVGMGHFAYEPGGLNRVYYHLMRSLPHVGVGVHGLIAAPDVELDGGLPDGARLDRFAKSDDPLPMRLWRARASAQRLRTEVGRPVDVIASHFALYTLPMLGALPDAPLVVHFQGPWADEGGAEGSSSLAQRAKHAVETQVYRRATLFIVLSHAFGRVLADRYGVPEERIRVVPAGVDAAAFDPIATRREARERLGWPRDRPIVLVVRRLARRMGIENAIEAMREIRDSVPDALLLIAGKGRLKEELEQRIAETGLRGHVRLLGFVPDEDLPLAYRAADLSLVPTVALEGFGLITLESLAAGTPVLVTPVGGLPEAVGGLSGDLIVGDATPGAIADAVSGALRGSRALPDADACRTYAREHHDWSVVARLTRVVYEEAIGYPEP